MSNVVVLGAGLNGLSTAMLLARDGHLVTVLEKDPAEPRGDNDALWSSWERRGVNQFNQLHFMLPRWTATMTRELPEVVDELEWRGGRRLNVVLELPFHAHGGPREGDERFETVSARRPVLEAAVAAVAARTPGVSIRRGQHVTGLLTASTNAVPRVTGVLTGRGTTVRADIVVDASGRRSAVASMLATIGARCAVEEREDSGFVYYGRHFRSSDGHQPEPEALLLQHFHGFSLLTLPADGDTWGVGFITSSRDRALRCLRDTVAWSRAADMVPSARSWCAGEPITDVQVIAGIEDRYRRYVVDGEPVVTGIVAVGDAWACTNPSLGRGASIGLLHAVALRDLLRDVGPDDAERLVRAFDGVTEDAITPWYRATLAFDRHRLAEVDADIAGTPYRTADPSWAMGKALYGAALRDPDVLRAHASIVSLLAMPQEALAHPGLVDRVVSLGANTPRYPEWGPAHADLAAVARGDTQPALRRTVGARPQPRESVPESDGMVALDGIRMFVQDEGEGPAVLLLHGWPDTHGVWRHQVPALTGLGYRVIAPDLRGFGASDKPADVREYGMLQVVGDLLTLLDRLGLREAHVVGHDWGGAFGAVLAGMAPSRVASLACLSVGHPAAFGTAGWEQRQKSWYMLLFQFPAIAERWLSENDFANLRAWSRHPDIEEVVTRLRDPADLTASLGFYRSILPPESLLVPPAELPPIQVPTMGVWSTQDVALTEQAITGTERFVAASWRYERIEGAGHWMQLDQPDRLNDLLTDFLASQAAVRTPALASDSAVG